MKVVHRDHHQDSLSSYLARNYLGESSPIEQAIVKVKELLKVDDDYNSDGNGGKEKIDAAIDEHFSEVFEACRDKFGRAWREAVLQNYHLSRVIRPAEEAAKDDNALEPRASDSPDGTVSENEFVNSCSLNSKRTGSEIGSVSPSGDDSTFRKRQCTTAKASSEATNDASVTVDTQPSNLNLSPSEKRM